MLQVMKHESKYIHPGFETQANRCHKSEKGVSVAPIKALSYKKCFRSREYSPDTINAHARTCQPRANADEGYYGNEEHPEPEEHVDLLVVPEERNYTE